MYYNLWLLIRHIYRFSNNIKKKILTLNPFKLSTTHANSASLPIVTVILGIGSANRGKLASEIHYE